MGAPVTNVPFEAVVNVGEPGLVPLGADPPLPATFGLPLPEPLNVDVNALIVVM